MAQEGSTETQPLDTPPRALGTTTLSTPAAPLGSTLHPPGAPAPQPLLVGIRIRLRFERVSTRLYEALLDRLGGTTETAPARAQRGAPNPATVLQFRNEEAAHFELLCEALACLGADPVAELDATAAHIGIDLCARRELPPDLAQTLDELLDIEQADEAGWRRLLATARACGLDELAHRFEQAHAEEIVHVRELRRWRAQMPTAQRRVA